MVNQSKIDRRRFLSIASLSVATAGLNGITLAKAESAATTTLDPEKSKIYLSNFHEIKQVKTRDLSIGYVEVGNADGHPVILLHGWPYDIHSYAEAAEILAKNGFRIIVPHLRGHGSTTFLDNNSLRNGQQSALAVDVIELMDALSIKKAIIGGFDWGARTAGIVAALWPERCEALVSVSGYLIGSQKGNATPLSPKAELAWWYQYYFATERGRLGYQTNTNNFAKLIWQLASPTWNFTTEEFDKSMKSLMNPDHVDIVIHNYRWRLGLAEGESRYDVFENILATKPPISVPAITLEGDANGAPHPEPSSYADKFQGKYIHRTLKSIGHNFPQEAPEDFAAAITDVAAFVN